MPARRKAAKKDSTAHLGFETELWLAADKLRNNMDAAEYKHVILGLIFLKYISDTFEKHRAKLLAGEGDYAGVNPEDPDEYKAENVGARRGPLVAPTQQKIPVGSNSSKKCKPTS